MSKKSERQAKILQIVREQGMLPAKTLASMLDTSFMTIYRDLDELRRDRKLQDGAQPSAGNGAEGRAPHIYLSGPDLFYPDYEKILAEKLRLCREYGFHGLPNESTVLTPPYNDADLFEHTVGLIEQCDIMVANLNAFRGPEPDSGTVWECTYGVCNKMRVYGYSNYPDMISAVEERYSQVFWKEINGVSIPFDKDGNRIENWGKTLNLMLTHSIILVQGGFEDAIKLVARDYSNQFWR